MMSRASLFAIAVLFLYGAPANALTRVAPPGNSGVSEYQENVPSAGGGIPVGKLPAASHTQALPHTVEVALDNAGKAGRAAAQFANRTAPVVLRKAHGSHSGANAPASSKPQATSNPGSQLASAIAGGSGGGLGLLLPAVLAGFLMVAVATVLARRRHAAR